MASTSSFGSRNSRLTTDLAPTIWHDCLAILRKYVVASEIILAIHAAEGLTEIGFAEEVREALLPRYRNASEDRHRCLLARELARAGDQERIADLLLGIEGTDESLQIAAAESLFKLRQVGDEHILRRALAGTSNAKLRLMLCASFACHGDQDSLAQIRNSLLSPAADVRKIAAWILTRAGNASDIAYLQECKSSEEDATVRAYMDHALAVLGDNGALPFLQQNLHSENKEVRQMATDSARLLESSFARKELGGLLVDSDFDVRIRAAHGLLYHYERQNLDG